MDQNKYILALEEIKIKHIMKENNLLHRKKLYVHKIMLNQKLITEIDKMISLNRYYYETETEKMLDIMKINEQLAEIKKKN